MYGKSIVLGRGYCGKIWIMIRRFEPEKSIPLPVYSIYTSRTLYAVAIISAIIYVDITPLSCITPPAVTSVASDSIHTISEYTGGRVTLLYITVTVCA